MHQVVGGRAVDAHAASTSQMMLGTKILGMKYVSDSPDPGGLVSRAILMYDTLLAAVAGGIVSEPETMAVPGFVTRARRESWYSKPEDVAE